MDENDKIVPAGVSGELCTRGKIRGCTKRTGGHKSNIRGFLRELCTKGKTRGLFKRAVHKR